MLPWCLVIGMSLIVRLDPNLPSLSKLDSLNLLSYFFLLKGLGLACVFSRIFCHTHLTFPLLVQFSFPCEMYPVQSLRMHSSFHKTPSLR